MLESLLILDFRALSCNKIILGVSMPLEVIHPYIDYRKDVGGGKP